MSEPLKQDEMTFEEWFDSRGFIGASVLQRATLRTGWNGKAEQAQKREGELLAEIEALTAERDTARQSAEQLKQQLADAERKLAAVVELCRPIAGTNSTTANFMQQIERIVEGEE